jgi:hypothetical protein
MAMNQSAVFRSVLFIARKKIAPNAILAVPLSPVNGISHHERMAGRFCDQDF